MRKTRLTFDSSQAVEPAWSPDGRWIAYQDIDQGGIWRLPASGGEAVRLTTFGSRPAWSPDSQTLAFQSSSVPAVSDTSAAALGSSQLWILDLTADNMPPQPLTEVGAPPGAHGAPAWSPDGLRLAFTTSQRGRAEIWTVDRQGGGVQALVRDPATVADPAFSSNGRSVYFSAAVQQVHGLWRVSISERTGAPVGGPERIANLGLASIRQLAIAPDDSKIAYAAITTRSNLWSLTIDPESARPNGSSRALTQGSARNNRPAWSPDGQWLAYDHWRLGVNLDVFLMDRNGEGQRALTTGPESESMPGWLATSDRVAFLARYQDTRGVFSVHLSDAEISTVAPLADEVDWARLSPDGTRLAYHARGDDARFNVWVRDLATGRSWAVTQAESLSGFPVWSRDGEWLAYQRHRGSTSHVMVVSPDGGTPQQLTFGRGQSWPYTFSPDGDKVAFAGQRDDGWGLWWVSRSTGAETRLAGPAPRNAYYRYPAWSPQGDRVVYELAETIGDIWLVENFL